MRCEYCGNKLEQGSRYCEFCKKRTAYGKEDEPQWYFCPECGVKNRTDRNACARCGAPIPHERVRKTEKQSGRNKRKHVRRIWAIVFIVLLSAAVCAAAGFLLGNRNTQAAAANESADRTPQVTQESSAEPAFVSAEETSSPAVGFADDADVQTLEADSASALAGAALCIITDCFSSGDQRYITIDYVSFYNDTDPESKVGIVRCKNDSVLTSTFPVSNNAVFSMAVTDLSDESWYDEITYDMELNDYYKEADWDTIASCYQTQTSWGSPSYFWVALDEDGFVDCIWQEIEYYYAD